MSNKHNPQTLAEFKNRLELARKLVREYVAPDRHLVDELIHERRLAAQREWHCAPDATPSSSADDQRPRTNDRA